MKKFLESIRIKLPKLKIPESLTNRASGSSTRGKADRFTLVSWGVTALIVVVLLSSALWWKSNQSASAPAQVPTAAPNGNPALPVPGSGGNGKSGIERALQLKTNIPERPRYKSVMYRVTRGDAMLAIAGKYKVKSETILYVNKELGDNPHSLKPGMELLIPPVDGLYYQWSEGDTFEKVAEKFHAKADDIINFPGNNIDLTDPKVEPGTMVMIPGGSRDLRNWEQDLQTSTRVNNGSTGTSDFGSNSCGGGPVDNTFGYPTYNHSVSGNDYGPGHLGVDFSANEGDPIVAAAAGVVTMAQGGWNYGYGNVVQIDHGNGYVTVYAHLSQINVAVCESVGQGTLIGLAGSTGNAFGAHLHFEIRIGGSNVNPRDYISQ